MSSLIVTINCRRSGLLLRVVCAPRETPLKALIFLFASGYQLATDSELRMGPRRTSPLSAVNLYDFNLFRPC